MRIKQKSLNGIRAVFFSIALFSVSSALFAQVKIGTNPTSIDLNSNFEVESSTTGNKVNINKTSGKVTIADGSQGTGKVLTSDANGLATWQMPTQTVPTIVSANQSGPQQIALGDNYLSFGSETIDRNNDFNSTTGVFTAPSSGIYLFNVFSNVDGHTEYQLGRVGFNILVEIIGVKSILICGGVAFENDWGWANGSTMVNLTAGQQVRINFHAVPGGTGNYDRTITVKRLEITKISN